MLCAAVLRVKRNTVVRVRCLSTEERQEAQAHQNRAEGVQNVMTVQKRSKHPTKGGEKTIGDKDRKSRVADGMMAKAMYGIYDYLTTTKGKWSIRVSVVMRKLNTPLLSMEQSWSMR